MYTIGSFLREEELTGLKLMTDTADLQAEITNINIIDNPDSYDWLSSGDFLLTTGYFFRDDEAMQRQLVRELSELGCVGLAIKTRRYLDVIPEAMLEEANRLGFPLIDIPVQYPLSKICKVVFDRLSGGGVERPTALFRFIIPSPRACWRQTAFPGCWSSLATLSVMRCCCWGPSGS